MEKHGMGSGGDCILNVNYSPSDFMKPQSLEYLTEEADSSTSDVNYSPTDSMKRQWLELLTEEADFSTSDARNSKPPRIQKVPVVLRNEENMKKYFTPRIMAIGPIHSQNTDLELGETIKRRLAGQFLKNKCAYDLYRRIERRMEAIRDRFEPEVIQKYDNVKFCQMLLVDGCAVLQCVHYSTDFDIDLFVINIQCLDFAINDMLLLENQIPFMVLKLLMGDEDQKKAWMKKIEWFVGEQIMVAEPYGRDVKQSKEKTPCHLLDLLRNRLLQTPKKGSQGYIFPKLQKMLLRPWHKSETISIRDGQRLKLESLPKCAKLWRLIKKRWTRYNRNTRSFRNVKELKERGIYFKKSKTSYLKDVSFSSLCVFGILRLPPIKIKDSTAPNFMNLIAYEMFPEFQNDFGVTSYVCFLNCLIDLPEDVAELRGARILDNYLGSDDIVAKIFNEIGYDSVVRYHMYGSLMTDIDRHCNVKWKTWLAQAFYQYFSSPWTFLAFAGAIIALILTGIQTYYTVYSPGSH